MPSPPVKKAYIHYELIVDSILFFVLELQKVIGRSGLGWTPPGVRGGGIKDVKGVIHFFSNLQDGSDVPTPITIVGCGPHRDQPITKHHFVALHDQLMRPTYEPQVVAAVKLWWESAKMRLSGRCEAPT